MPFIVVLTVFFVIFLPIFVVVVVI